MPWTEFLDGTLAETCVWRIGLVSVAHISVRAAALLQAGFFVSCCGTPAKFTCVKSMHLKWTTDDACASTMSTIHDTMPGLTLGADVYTVDFQVHRCMLHWSMLAGFRSHQPASGPVAEPLKSYVETLAAVKAHRKLTGRVDDFRQASAVLKFNTPARLTSAQHKQALSIFYWASVCDSRPLSEADRNLFHRALNMYLHFGFVVLRKRSYEFRGNGKKKQAAFTRISSARAASMVLL